MSFIGNQQHLDVFKKGVKVWNSWRCDNLQIKPDLRGLDVASVLPQERVISNIGEEKSGIYLVSINLSETNLQGAVFEDAILLNANFKGANLSSANLKGANLARANLKKTNLSKTNLQKTNVAGVIYSGGILCLGVKASTCYGHKKFRAFLKHKSTASAVKQKSVILYYAWLFTSNCGKSYFSWLTLTFALFIFSLYYTPVSGWPIIGALVKYAFYYFVAGGFVSIVAFLVSKRA